MLARNILRGNPVRAWAKDTTPAAQSDSHLRVRDRRCDDWSEKSSLHHGGCGPRGRCDVGLRQRQLAIANRTNGGPNPRPIFTVTLTPTNTPMLTNTPLPTDTGTPMPIPTNTPSVDTASPIPLPTKAPPPTASPTDQPSPTSSPTGVPQPTHTPELQFAWTGEVSNTFDNCARTRVFGFVLDRNGNLAGNVWLHFWADGWTGMWTQSSSTEFGADTPLQGDEGNWDGPIDNSKVRQNTWHVCIVPEEGSWTCISNTVDATTTLDCTPATGVQEVQITFRQN